MSEICPNCGSGFVEKCIIQNINHNPPHDITYRHESVCGACYHVFQTIFDSITASPEVLAEKLVYQFIAYDRHGLFVSCWRSVLTGDIEYYTEAEAIAATLAKLQEVYR